MPFILASLRRFWPHIVGLLLLIAALAYSYRLGDNHGFHKRDAEVAALQQTIADVRTKTAQAQAADALHKVTVETAQQKVSTDASTAYQRELAALRTRYDSLRDNAQANPGSSGSQAVPSVSNSASGPACEAEGNRLLYYAREADENTLKLTKLQEWVEQQQKVER